MDYTAKDYEFLGRQTAAGKYISRSTFILALVLALLVGVAAGRYVFPSGGGDAVRKVPIGQTGDIPGAVSPAKELAESILAHEEQVRKEPDNAEAWTHLGDLYYQADQPANSVRAYEKSLSIKPGDPDVLTDCGTMYRAMRQYDKALEYYSRAIEAKPDHQNALFNSGVVLYYDLNRKADGLDKWRAVSRFYPQAKAPSGQPMADFIKAHEAKQ